MFHPGETVGSYRITHQLGAGGMGIVYAADHVHLKGRRAAIKVLHPWIVATNPDIVERFQNEALAASIAEHHNVCRVYDLGQLANGQWFLVMEFLHGESLHSYIAARGGHPVDPPTALHILAEAACGLHHAHERGIVHRDVKPENLLRTPLPNNPHRIKVVDFGIAKLRDGIAMTRTRDQVVMGTPAYMAPEQLLHGAATVDRRADLYALACIAAELLTGRSPLAHLTTVNEIIAYHQSATPPPDPRALCPDLPKPLAKAVMRGMHRDPMLRYADAAEMVQAFAAAIDVPGYADGGMGLVRRFAAELAEAPSDGPTAGRHLPSALLAMGAGPTTSPARPIAMGMTLSDGVPLDPSAPPRVAVTPPPSGAPSPVLSTFGHSSGQIVHPTMRARSRRPLVIASVVVGAVVIAAIVALVLRTDRDGEAAAAAPEPAPVAGIDAGPTMSALAVITEPAGAVVLVDGVPHGVAPINVLVPRGAEVVVRAELPGYAPAGQTLTIGEQPATVRLSLAYIEPASPAIAAPSTEPASPSTEPAASGPAVPKPTKPEPRRRSRHARDARDAKTDDKQSAAATPTAPPKPASRRGTFSVDDVGGD